MLLCGVVVDVVVVVAAQLSSAVAMWWWWLLVLVCAFCVPEKYRDVALVGLVLAVAGDEY